LVIEEYYCSFSFIFYIFLFYFYSFEWDSYGNVVNNLIFLLISKFELGPNKHKSIFTKNKTKIREVIFRQFVLQSIALCIMYIYMCVYICAHIYLWRERDRERDKDRGDIYIYLLYICISAYWTFLSVYNSCTGCFFVTVPWLCTIYPGLSHLLHFSPFSPLHIYF
jgi:hypothetical protein